jgi:hypothetical protein
MVAAYELDHDQYRIQLTHAPRAAALKYPVRKGFARTLNDGCPSRVKCDRKNAVRDVEHADDVPREYPTAIAKAPCRCRLANR